MSCELSNGYKIIFSFANKTSFIEQFQVIFGVMNSKQKQ